MQPDGSCTVTCVATGSAFTPDGFNEYAFQYTDTNPTGLAADTGNDLAGTASSPAMLDGHVDPRPIMDVGVMNGNIPAPLVAIDEDDELFLTLTNVGMIMRPDLFEQHTIHFHGYPNASSFYDGVPDASVAINIGASFTYYYEAPDAGTYFYHCHITPPEHLQMGMVGQLYVRPRQDRVPSGTNLYSSLAAAEWRHRAQWKPNPGDGCRFAHGLQSRDRHPLQRYHAGCTEHGPRRPGPRRIPAAECRAWTYSAIRKGTSITTAMAPRLTTSRTPSRCTGSIPTSTSSA